MSDAERLAQRLTDLGPIDFDDVAMPAAAELRRLSAELAALKAAMGEPVAWANPSDMIDATTSFRWIQIGEFTRPLYALTKDQS